MFLYMSKREAKKLMINSNLVNEKVFYEAFLLYTIMITKVHHLCV